MAIGFKQYGTVLVCFIVVCIGIQSFCKLYKYLLKTHKYTSYFSVHLIFLKFLMIIFRKALVFQKAARARDRNIKSDPRKIMDRR